MLYVFGVCNEYFACLGALGIPVIQAISVSRVVQRT